MHRVVVILGIRRIDRDQRQRAPIFARKTLRLQRGGARGVRFGDRLRPELCRNVVHVDCDKAHGLFACGRADDFANACRRQPKPILPLYIDGDKIAVFGAAEVGFGNR